MNVESGLPPEKAMEILKQGGLVVNISEAALILEFLNKIAYISLNASKHTI